MRSQVSLEALHAAWNAMRVRPAFKNWPGEFDQVMADPVRKRLVNLEALHPASPPKMVLKCRQNGVESYLLSRSAVGHQQLTSPQFFDHKRAASGDRDD